MTPAQQHQSKDERDSKCAVCDNPAQFYCLQSNKLLCQEDKQVIMQQLTPPFSGTCFILVIAGRIICLLTMML